MKTYVITSFYKFIPVPEYKTLKQSLLKAMKSANVLGTIILAEEGINGSLAGKRKNIDRMISILTEDARFNDIWFKETHSDNMPFEKAKVKLRKEIVTMGVADTDPLKEVGTYVRPEEWNALISAPDVLLIDTRNNYEVGVGTFKGAINPNTPNFRDFPEYVKNNLMDKKDQKIAMCCTGGVRCERSTAYLKKLGFKAVYHLEGGILNYIDSIPENESLWEGKCFVFDERIAV